MKQSLFIILFFLIFTLPGVGEEKETLSPWERLQRTEKNVVLDFMNPANAKDKFIICPSTVEHPKMPEEQKYIVEMTRIRSLLEKAGITEPVTIEVYKAYKQKKYFITHLGSYEPIETGQGKGLMWILPKYKVIKIPRREIHALARDLHHREAELDSPLLGVEEKWLLLFKDSTGKIQASLKAVGFIFLRYQKRQYAELDRLLVEKQEQKAIAYCSKLKGKLRYECFNILGTGLFREDLNRLVAAGNDKAVEAYCEKHEGELRSQCCRLAGEACFEQKDYQRAVEYFSSTGYKESNNNIGEAYYQMGDFKKAAEYHENGLPCIKRARAYSRLADDYKTQGEKKLAKAYYKKALQEYEFMLKDDEYEWNDNDNAQRLRCRREIAAFEKSPEEKDQEQKLKRILEKTSLYCQRLEKAMIHFFCREEIEELFLRGPGITARNTFVYEYQLIQEGKQITERRILLSRNGQKMREENVPLGTTFYQYNKLIFGPIGFFDKFWQDYFDYKIIKEEMYNGQQTVVIEAIPLRKLKNNFICGKIWVDSKDYGILKIQWEPKFFLNNFRKAVESAKWHNAQLQIDFISEFNKERNGIRFPSRYYIGEYHVYEEGKQKIRAMLDVNFKKFMFFTVGTDVQYEKMGVPDKR